MAILCVLASFNVAALDPDHTFNYQGELLDNGSPANNNYDIRIRGFFAESGGNSVGISEHLNVVVENGTFNLNNVNIGTAPFDDKELWLEINVREASVGGYTTLSPRQELQAVPYANKLTNGNASDGQVLTFDGRWKAANPVVNSFWEKDGADLIYRDGNVGIGSHTTSAALTVQAAPGDGDVFRARVGNSTKFLVHNNSGSSVGSNTVPPEFGLRVKGDAIQNVESNGMLKYMVQTQCNNTGASPLNRFYDGTSTGTVTVSNGNAIGKCNITFPFNITQKYWQVSPISDGNSGATCVPNGNTLNCKRFESSTGAGEAGFIIVLIY